MSEAPELKDFKEKRGPPKWSIYNIFRWIILLVKWTCPRGYPYTHHASKLQETVHGIGLKRDGPPHVRHVFQHFNNSERATLKLDKAHHHTTIHPSDVWPQNIRKYSKAPGKEATWSNNGPWMDQSPVTVPEHMPHLVPDHEKSTSLRGHLGTKSQKCVSPKKKNPLRQTNGFLNLEWDVDGFPCDFRMPWDFHWMLQHSEAPNTRHGAGQADEHPLKKKQRLGMDSASHPRNPSKPRVFGGLVSHLWDMIGHYCTHSPRSSWRHTPSIWVPRHQQLVLMSSDKAAEQTHWNRPINSFQ